MSLHVVHIALGKANPNRQNGVNKVIHELASAQTAAGIHTEFWGITRNPVHDYPERNYPTQLFKHLRFAFSLDKKLVAALVALDPNHTVVHLHGGFTPQLYAVARILVRKHIPYIHTSHGAYNLKALEKSGSRKKLYIRLFERYLITHAAKIHLIGISEAKGLQQLFGKTEFVLIPNGQSPIPETSNPQVSSSLRFGYIGRIDIQGKGLIKLLDGYHQFVHATQSDVALHIIGDGPELPELKRYAAKLGLEKRVHFPGSIYGDEKFSYLRTLHAFILPSESEGMPGVVLEALACGIPCIVSKATNLGEFIADAFAGIVLAENTAEDIAAAFTEVLSWSDETLEGVSARARELVRTTFNWNVIAMRFKEVYLEILTPHSHLSR